MSHPRPHSPLPGPVACSLEPDSGRERIARWRALAERALESSTRTSAGARQRYRADSAVERELDELVALERECCPFLSFALVRRGSGLELDVSGPVDAGPILDAFATGTERRQGCAGGRQA